MILLQFLVVPFFELVLIHHALYTFRKKLLYVLTELYFNIGDILLLWIDLALRNWQVFDDFTIKLIVFVFELLL